MIQIDKGTEPVCLVKHRCKAGAKYDANDWDKESLREHLLELQGHLCALCMRRIYLADTRIAHVLTQKEFPEQQLSYGNLVLACPGGEVKGLKNDTSKYHCDKSQEHKSLMCNPSDASHRIEERISYLSDGTIKGTDADIEHDIKLMRLNDVPNIKSGRKATLDAFVKTIPPATLKKSWLLRQMDNMKTRDAKGQRKQYCGVTIYWLRRKLNNL